MCVCVCVVGPRTQKTVPYLLRTLPTRSNKTSTVTTYTAATTMTCHRLHDSEGFPQDVLLAETWQKPSASLRTMHKYSGICVLSLIITEELVNRTTLFFIFHGTHGTFVFVFVFASNLYRAKSRCTHRTDLKARMMQNLA